MNAKKILIITGVLTLLAYITAILTATKLKFKFLGFESLLSSIVNKKAVEFNVEIINPTMLGLRVSDLNIRIVNEHNKNVLKFLPVDMVVKSNATTYTKFTFEEGNAVGLLGDYLNKSYKKYKVIVKGRILGVFPFYYKTNLVTD